MSRRFLILANPIAGGGRARALAPRLQDELRRLGASAELHFTTSKGDARARAAAIVPASVDAIVGVGGDGTLNEILNGLADPSLPLAVLPLGTANVLAKELRLPADPPALARLLHTGTTLEAALGEANGRRFLLFCGVGVDGQMVEALERRRRGKGGLRSWVGPVGEVAWRWPRTGLRVTLDASRTLHDVTELLATRVRNYGGMFTMPGAIDIRDGELHAITCTSRRRLGYAWHALRAALGCLQPSASLGATTARTIRVEAERPVPYQIDGDLGGTTPVEIRCLHTRARLFHNLG